MSRQSAMQWVKVQYSLTRLGAQSTSSGSVIPGGFDQTTPSLSLQPGALRDVSNFECNQSGGYSRIDGYERVDGHPAPSSASYVIVQVDGFNSQNVIYTTLLDGTMITVDGVIPLLSSAPGVIELPEVGDNVSQLISGATGTIAFVNNVPGQLYLVVTKITGVFDQTHPILVNGAYIGMAVTTTVSQTSKQSAQYTAASADIYRADILAVPGSGKVLGVVSMIFSGTEQLYAFRANTLGTAVLIWKRTSAGWVNVPLLKSVIFTGGGTLEPYDGETLTQGGVTAVIKRVVWQDGAWSATGGSASGQFVIATPTGGHFASGAATTSGGATVTLSGVETSISLLPGGRYQFVKCNFSGQASTRRIYGCDGVNKCFEFDGETYTPITTGLTNDSPTNILYHHAYLFVSKDGSLMHSGPGTPYMWSSVLGGGEFAVGDDITGILTFPGSVSTAALFVFCKSNTLCLYGTNPDTFNLVSFNTGIGGIQYSAQNLMDGFVFDDIGIITLRATLNYGNFNPTSLTKNIMPFIRDEHSKLSASCVSRNKSQYRSFFSDGYGLYMTMVNQNYLGSTPVAFPNPVYCIDVGETDNGTEVIYFASSDALGYVYQLDAGTSFDGVPIDAYATLAWDPFRSSSTVMARILKRYRAASIEIQSTTYTEIDFGYQLAYGSSNVGQPNPVSYQTSFSDAPYWDSFTWDNFVWDGQTLTPTEIDLTGTGENIQVTIRSSSNYIGAFTLNSIIYHYTSRRGLRP